MFLNEYWVAAVGSAIGFLATVAAGLELPNARAQQSARRFSRSADPTATGPIARRNVRRIARSWRRLPRSPASSASNRARTTAIGRPIGKRSKRPETEAAASAEKGDYAAAIRQYSAAIRKIMKKFREQGRTTEDSSAPF